MYSMQYFYHIYGGFVLKSARYKGYGKINPNSSTRKILFATTTLFDFLLLTGISKSCHGLLSEYFFTISSHIHQGRRYKNNNVLKKIYLLTGDCPRLYSLEF